MDLIENLVRYTKYAQGDLESECSLKYEDIAIKDFDFSKFDLNNSTFLGVLFDNCNFSSVYLSGSHFGGSKFTHCEFNKNTLKKANWSYVKIQNTHVYGLDAFRVDFFNADITDSIIEESSFFKCMFVNSSENAVIKNVIFKKCNLERVNFQKCAFTNTVFEDCKLKNSCFDSDLKGVLFKDCIKET